MQTTINAGQIRIFRAACVAALLAGAAAYALFTIHWPWMWDEQVMHYITLLLRHGKLPYREIQDINMPGSYLSEWAAVSVFGPGNLGWRLYEFTLLAVMTGAMIVIARPYDWLAGLFAGVMFTVLHGSEGPIMSVQRDEVITVLLFVGYAFLFTSVRRLQPIWMLPFGFVLGFATTIKPTVAPFAFALLLYPIFGLRETHALPTYESKPRRWLPYILYGSAGLAVAASLILIFLMRSDSLRPFFAITGRLLPYYAKMNHPSFATMVRLSLPRTFLIYVPLAILAAYANKTRATWEIWALRLGFAFGAVSYFVQHKGYAHHRYPYLAFGLLWIGIEFTNAMRKTGWVRNLGVAAMALSVFLMVPFNAMKTRTRPWNNALADTLTTDLAALGPARLQNKIQCLDVVSGCLTALYRLDLVQSTGFTGDLQFFSTDDGDVVPQYRRKFLDDLQSNPPTAIVLTDQWYARDRYSFDKLSTWPELESYLATAYTVRVTRDIGNFEGNDLAYRIYILNGAT